jgi:hypothetical protein
MNGLLSHVRSGALAGFSIFCIFAAGFPSAVLSEEGTRAKTMRNETQRVPKSSSPPAPERTSDSNRPAPDYSRPEPRFDPPQREEKPGPSSTGPAYYADDTKPAEIKKTAETKKKVGAKSASAAKTSEPSKTTAAAMCLGCSDDEGPRDEQSKFEKTVREKGSPAKYLSVNSRIAFTNWNFNFSPAIQYESTFFPTYELDLNAFGFEFSYMTAIPPQPANLFREIPLVGQENTVRNSVMECLRLGALPLTFMKHPLLQNLLAVEFKKTTKSTTIIAAQNLYYFPYTTSPGLTQQESDLGMIYYEQKPAGTRLSYNIKERDWLVTLGIFAFRIGYFDINYSKPYQMDADIYQGNTLIDRRIFLFEGQATGRGLFIGLQNLYFPTWDTRRFYFTTPDLLADGFFWGLKELGFYWGSGSILLQENIDLVEKYRVFYQGETGRKPSVAFQRQVFHVVMGYKFNDNFRVFIEYRYANYSLALRDSYEDSANSYFLNHALNRDTVQQFGINLTLAF